MNNRLTENYYYKVQLLLIIMNKSKGKTADERNQSVYSYHFEKRYLSITGTDGALFSAESLFCIESWF